MSFSKDSDISIAAAIEYDDTHDHAPRLTAKGRGVLAEKIIELARTHNVPIKKDPALVELLSRLDINEEIPPELYRAVAEIFAFLYRMNEMHRNHTSKS